MKNLDELKRALGPGWNIERDFTRWVITYEDRKMAFLFEGKCYPEDSLFGFAKRPYPRKDGREVRYSKGDIPSVVDYCWKILDMIELYPD